MSQERVEILQRLKEALNRRDIAGALDDMDPAVEFYPGIQVPDEDSRYVGREGVERWFRSATDASETVAIERREIIEAADNRFLAVDQWLFRGRNGIEIEREISVLAIGYWLNSGSGSRCEIPGWRWRLVLP